MAAVALIGLDKLAWFKEVCEDFDENFNFSILTGRAGTLDPHQVPCQNINARLVAQGGLPRVLVRHEDVALFCESG